MHKEWTDEAKECLRTTWATTPAMVVAEACGMSRSATYTMARKLGLSEARPKRAAVAERATYGTDFHCAGCHRNRSLVGSRKAHGRRWCGACCDAARAAAVEPPVTRCKGYPGYDVRYAVDPNERVIGGFESMRIGHYLDDERGRA